jgi:hypothetical protein
MQSRGALWVATLVAAIVALVNEPSPLGSRAVLWFLAVVPGALLVRRVGLTVDGAGRWVIVVAASFAIDTLFTEALVYAHLWTPMTATLALAALCSAALTYEAFTTRPLTGPTS